MIQVTDDGFIPFLRWLVNDRQYSANNIINVVDKPHSFKLEYNQYLEEDDE